MKAACLIFCFTLPHLILGNVFRMPPQNQMMPYQKPFVNPLDYIDQYQYRPRTENSKEQSQENNSDIATHIQKYFEMTRFDPNRFATPEQRKYIKDNLQWSSQKNNEMQKPFHKKIVNKKYYGTTSTEQRDLQQNWELPLYQQQQDIQQDTPNERYGLQSKSMKKSSSYPNTKSNSQQKMKYQENSQESQTRKTEASSKNIQWNYDGTPMRKDSDLMGNYADPVIWNGIALAVGPSDSIIRTPKDIEGIYGDALESMRQYTDLEKNNLRVLYQTHSRSESRLLNATEMLNNNGYPVENYTVKTDDGYLLKLFRMTPKEDKPSEYRPVVFLMHGVFGSADEWLLMGPKKSLAYQLVDAGYEVWLGNARGNRYSRRHVTKHPSTDDFWQFNFDDIALHDLPAMIDFVLQVSQQKRMFYVGHAQGTTTFLALASQRPEYNNKIMMLYALSPMMYMSNVRSPLLKMVQPSLYEYDQLNIEGVPNGEFRPPKEIIHTLGGNICEKVIGSKAICENINFVMSGFNMEQQDDVISTIMRYLPAGASTGQIKQLGQAVANKEFRMYDYGAQKNKLIYGTPEPPRYEMSRVSAPVALYYSTNDWEAHPADVARLQKALPNVVDTYKVPEKYFGSLEFLFGKNAPSTVYQRITESIKNVTQQS